VLTLDASAKLEDLDGEKAVEIGKAGKVDVVLLGTVLEPSRRNRRKVDGSRRSPVSRRACRSAQ
jgi:hypothetical protein